MLAKADLADAKPSPEPLPKNPEGVNGSLALAPDYPELRLFGLLMWRFGRPNGPLSVLGIHPDGDPDAPFKWDFLFVASGNLRLHVVRGVGGIEVYWWGEDAAAADVLAYLESNLTNHQPEISQAIDQLEVYTLILNPYVRHRDIAAFALEELNQIDPKEPQCPRGKQSVENVEEYLRQQKAYMDLVERQASLMLLVVTESAFMAEAFLNLLISFLARKELRDSPSLMKGALKQKWRDKVDRMHVDCNGFKAAANPKESRMEAAHRLFDIRNKVAHSTLHKVDMAVGKMWFYKSFPLLERGEPFKRFAIALNNQHPSLEQARFCKQAADDLVQYLMELLDDDLRDQVRFAVSRNPLGYNETKEIYGIPFGEDVIISVTYRNDPASKMVEVRPDAAAARSGFGAEKP